VEYCISFDVKRSDTIIQIHIYIYYLSSSDTSAPMKLDSMVIASPTSRFVRAKMGDSDGTAEYLLFTTFFGVDVV
jgi:hypothetical protein